MRYLIFTAALVVTLAPPVRSQQAADSIHVVQAIRQLEEDWARALIEQDSVRLTRILAPEFALVASANAEQPLFRGDWLALLPRYRTRALPINQLTVRVMGDLAIASFVTNLQATVAGVDRSNILFVTDVWRKRDAGWEVVARYSSVPEPGRAATQELRSKRE